MDRAKQLANRKRLLKPLDNKAIHRLSERLNPEYATRPELEAEIIHDWPDEKVRREILALFEKAA